MSARQILRGGRRLNPGDDKFGAVDVLIRGAVVEALLAPGTPAPADAAEIDVAGMLMHPGLINAHTHGHGSLCKGMGDRWTLELLLTASVWTYANRSAEDRHTSTMLAAAEMALKGCTTCYDLNMELPGPTVEGIISAGQAYTNVGIRAVLAPAIADRSFFAAIPGLLDALPDDLGAALQGRSPGTPDTIQQLDAAYRSWPFDRDQIRPAIAPTIPMHCSDDLLLSCRRLVHDHGLLMQSHVAESKLQGIYGGGMYGRPVIAHLDSLGLVTEAFTVAHGVWLLEEEMALLGARGASVAHNPGSNMRIGSGIADVHTMRLHGVNVGIGTDGANCADHQNMYEAMRLASLVSRIQDRGTPSWLPTRDVWSLAALGGAKLTGFEGRLGRIAPGYFADIVFLEAGHVNWLPLNDAVNQLIHSEDATAVHSVMAGGRMIVRSRQLTTIDMPRLAARAEAARLRLAAMNVDNRALFGRLGEIVDRFCPGLARQHLPVNRFVTHDAVTCGHGSAHTHRPSAVP